MSVVTIDPAGRRQSGRDYLSVDSSPEQGLQGRRLGQVINFKAPLETRCTGCGKCGHRASQCPTPPSV